VSLPGQKVKEGSAPVSTSLPAETDMLFLGVLAERGSSAVARLIRSLDEFKAFFGQRVSYSLAYDYLDYYFRQGGSRAIIGRYTGAAAATATVTITDTPGTGTVWTATAVGPGTWYNGLNIIVTSGGGTNVAIQITHDTDTTINEYSGMQPDNTSLQAWADTSLYIRLVPGAAIASSPPAQTKNLGAGVAGADDTAGVTDATALLALQTFSPDMGPGQVAYAQRTSSTAQGQLLDHGAANNRFALCDPVDTTSKSTLLAAASALRSQINASWGCMAAPWIKMDGLTPGSMRDIPPSAAVAALLARNDSRGVSPGQAPGGNFGILEQARAVKATFPLDQDRDDLNEGSVNLIRSIGGTIKLYGFRSLVNPVTNPNWFQATSRRVYMTAAARGASILENYVLIQIDGRKRVLGRLQSELSSMMNDLYVAEALFGDTAGEAFAVDTLSDAVNPVAQLKLGKIKARVSGVYSPTGETIEMELIKQPIPG
jgi:hypothetical protein